MEDIAGSVTTALIESYSTRYTKISQYSFTEASTKAIALRLGLSPKTVEYHRASLTKKMLVANLVELINVVGPLYQSEGNPQSL